MTRLRLSRCQILRSKAGHGPLRRSRFQRAEADSLTADAPRRLAHNCRHCRDLAAISMNSLARSTAGRAADRQRRLAQAGASNHKIEQTLLRGGEYINSRIAVDPADADREVFALRFGTSESRNSCLSRDYGFHRTDAGRVEVKEYVKCYVRP